MLSLQKQEQQMTANHTNTALSVQTANTTNNTNTNRTINASNNQTASSSLMQPNQQMIITTNKPSLLTNDATNNLKISDQTTNNNGLLDLIMCKMVAPFHVVNDPRILECGSSACYQCIISSKDQDRNLKCPYCNNIHKIDANKLPVNKNLNQFLKFNFRQINQSFSKQLEDSMFALEQKIHNQNLTMENFDQYLTLVQNDVQLKIDTLKTHLEKYGEQFIDNLKTIRKEVQKKFQTCCKDYESRFNVYRQWIEHSSAGGSSSQNTNGLSNGNLANNNSQLTAVNLLNNDTLASLTNGLQMDGNVNSNNNNNNNLLKDKPFQVIGLKTDSLLPPNLNVLTVLNATNSMGMTSLHNGNHHFPTAYQINSTFQNNNTTSNNNASNTSTANNNLLSENSNNNGSNNLNDKQRSQNNSILNNNKSNNLLNHNNDNLSNSLDVLQNTFNFSNSSSWNANDDDLDDFDTDIANIKPTQSNNNNGLGHKRHLNKEQAQFNKFVREEVSKKFGEDFLLQHEVNQLESSVMEMIKNEAIASFLPKDTTPVRAWKLAKVSLRSLKRDLRRKQGINTSINKKDNNHNQVVNNNSYY